MSSNDLEVRVSELTNVIRGLSDKPMLGSSDVNNILNSLVQRVEDTNESGFDKLTEEISKALTGVLDEKYNDVKERLSVFETFITTVERTIKNPKLEGEITRVLNDIEALHSKMNSQEVQTDGLLKALENLKNFSNASQISRLSDEIMSISRSYEGIVDVLNGNFEEFLAKVESISSKEEYQRLRYIIETVEGNQKSLVSAMNVLNESQEEIKSLFKKSVDSRSAEKLELLQTSLSQINKRLNESTSKADMDIISDKISSAIGTLNALKRSIDDNETSAKNVISAQLNDVLTKIESNKPKLDASVNEDIIRLYTSIADLKDSLYSSLNGKLDDVIKSMDKQFDKVSGSMVNTTIETNDSVSNLTSEVQKLNNLVTDTISAGTLEIKDSLKKTGQENAVAVINSIKDELSDIMKQVSILNNNDVLSRLIKDVENLQGSFNTDSILMQIEQIKSALDFTSIKEQLEALNKEDVLDSIQDRIELVLDFVRSDEIITKLDEISKKTNLDAFCTVLNSIEGKLDFTSVENKIADLRNFLNNSDFSNEIASVKEKLAIVDNIAHELDSVKNLDNILYDIKNKTEETLLNTEAKINQDLQLHEDIKKALDNLCKRPVEKNGDSTFTISPFDIEDSVKTALIGTENKLEEKFKNNSNKIEETLKSNEEIKKSISELYQALLENKQKENFEDVKDKLETIRYEMADKVAENGLNTKNLLDKLREEVILIKNQSQEALSSAALNNITNSVNENLNNAVSKVNDSVHELNVSVDAIKNTVRENLNVTSFRLNASIKEIASNVDSSLKEIGEKIDSINLKTENNNDEKLEEIKTQIRNLSNSIQTVADNPINEQMEILVQNVISSNSDNSKEIIQNIENFKNSFTENIGILKNNLSEKQDKDNNNNSIVSLFDELETRLNDKLVSLETLIEETNGSVDEGSALKLKDSIENAKIELKNSLSNIMEEIISLKIKEINDIVKEQLSEIKADFSESLKQEIQNINSSQGEKLETTQKEILVKTAQMLAARENSEARINLIKSVTENLNEILNNTFMLKGSFQENTDMLSDINENLENINSKLNIKNEIDVDSIADKIYNKSKEANLEFTSTIDKNNKNIENSISLVRDSIISIKDNISNAINEKNLDTEEILTSINETIASIKDRISEIANENGFNTEQILTSVNETLALISSKVLEIAAKDDNTAIQDSINRLNQGLEVINSKLNEQISNSKTLDEDTISSLDDSIGIVKSRMEDILSSLSNTENRFDSINSSIDTVQNKLFDTNNELSRSFEDKTGSINFNIEEARSGLEATINESKNECIEKIDSINSNLEEIRQKISDDKEKANTEDFVQLNLKLNEIKEAITYNKDAELNIKNFETVNLKLEDIRQIVADNKEKSPKEDFNILNSRLEEIKNQITDVINNSSNKTETLNENFETCQEKTMNAIAVTNSVIEEKFNILNDTSDILQNRVSDLIIQNNSDLRNAINEVKDSINEIGLKVSDINVKNDDNNYQMEALSSLSNELSSIQGKIEALIRKNESNSEDSNNLIRQIEDAIYKSQDNYTAQIDNTKERVEEVKQEVATGVQRIIEQLKDEISMLGLSDGRSPVISLVTDIEQRIQEKVAGLENVLEDSVVKMDSKAFEILTSNTESYNTRLDERIDFLIEHLSADFETRLNEVQKIIDDKVYEIVKCNNDIIKDELKFRTDSSAKELSKDLGDKISKLETILSKENESENEETNKGYTLADVESDIATIKQGLEKSTKLSNFKEFAARLVELKNINLENAKISRVIGADVMRFDGWLKNTSAKIDVLAAKIDKSEKIKMEELKTRLSQTDKPQVSSQKTEEAIMSIYKKYRIQETKIDDISSKIEALSQKQDDAFNAKEFIDLFYDNAKKQESLIHRMDGIEDKMDLIQAKIDHIISSCIDE